MHFLLHRLSPRRPRTIACALLSFVLGLSAWGSNAGCGNTVADDPFPYIDVDFSGTLYRLQNGAYSPLPGSAKLSPNTTCAAVLQSQIEVARRVETNTQTGVVTVWSSDAPDAVPLGAGPLSWNQGTLRFGPAPMDNGTCQFQSRRSATLQLIADNTFTFAYAESRQSFMQSASSGSPPCTQQQDCQLAFDVTLTKPVQ